MKKDKDFDKVINVMKDQFNWKDDISAKNFAFTNELIKATKIVLGLSVVSPSFIHAGYELQTTKSRDERNEYKKTFF